MAYLLYSIVFLLLVSSTVLYFTRSRWIPLLPYSVADFSFNELPFSRYVYTPVSSSFEDDIENGLSSEDFNLQGNVSGGDSRSGLDEDAKREIKKIMKGSWIRSPCTFDEARRVYFERVLEGQGIGRDGRPRDPKFVSFS